MGAAGQALHKTPSEPPLNVFTMRLLERKPDGYLIIYEFTGKEVPAYTILSHTWHANNKQEVTL
jgi:hypothetical protein